MVESWDLPQINSIIYEEDDKALDYVRCELTEFVHRHLKSIKFFKISPKTTLCLLTFENGFEIIGNSSCINPLHYRKDIGSKYALRVAVNNASPIIAYQEQNLLQNNPDLVTYDKPD